MSPDLSHLVPKPQGSTTLSDGTAIEMPLLTYQASAIIAFFTVSAAKARALLPIGDLHAVRLTPGRALVAVQVMEYTHKNIEPYREFVVSLPVHLSKWADRPLASLALWERLPRSGLYVTHIGVDTEQARLAGWEILGFPKFIVDVEKTETTTERIAEVSKDNESIFTLAITKSTKPTREQRRDFYCYSLSPETNELFHIPYQSEATMSTTLGSRSARLHLGSHPVADELRDLDISPAPLFTLDAPQYSLVSNRPDARTDVGDWRDPRGIYRELRSRQRTRRLAP